LSPPFLLLLCHCEARSLSVIARSGSDEAIPHPTEIATPSARNDNKKGRNGTPFVIARHTVPKQSHALPGNPKLKALNPEQILISKFKTQKLFWSFDIV
jgi:hypothetical protein